MKIIYKSILILITLIIASSCVKEEMIKPDPSFILTFQRDGEANAMAGQAFYIIPTGSAEFFTLYNGTKGHVWGELGAKGIDFNKADSLLVQYSVAGTYPLTLVTSSTGNFAKDYTVKTKTVDINVVDQRNSFKVFNINGVDGNFAPNNEILFTVPDVVTDFNFVAVFRMDSDSAKAYVNGIVQVSKETVNDFSKPVVYTVKSAQGTEQQYTVKYSTFPASGEKALTKFALGVGGNGEVGVIDEDTKTINVTTNYATNLGAVRLVLASSYGSLMYLNNALYSDRKNYNLNTSKTIKIIAQNITEVTYNINVATENPVSAFTFEGLVPAPAGVIDVASKTIVIDVLKGTDVSKLVAKWTGSTGKVTIGSVAQTNGVTTNNFSKPLTYTFYKGSTAGDKYVVTVNIK
jgi:hypothetical protein